MSYAENTSVSPERSRGEIESTLRRYGADAFSYAFDGDTAAIAFRAAGRMVRFTVSVPDVSEFVMTGGSRPRRRTATQAQAARDQMERQRWRALLLVIKAKLESIDAGIETFDEAFMPHLLLPNGQRFGDWAAPSIVEIYESGDMPKMIGAGT